MKIMKQKGKIKMVSFKVYTNELGRAIKSVKKGIDKKGKDEFRGIRFQIIGDELIAYTSDGYKVFTNKLAIIEKETEIEEGFEFVTPVIRFPQESDDNVKITVDFEKNTIEYDFGKTKQIMEMYYLNANIDYAKILLQKKQEIKQGTEIVFNADNLRIALDGFGKRENVKLVIKSDTSLMLIESVTDDKNKRLVMPCV